MSLSPVEIEQLIDKLRNRYREYAAKHNKKWFSSDPFEERLQMARDNRMNLEGFILAEVANFEKLKEKYEKKKKDRPFSETVDTIIEENTAKIRKYPRIEFHPRAGFELSYFYGAMSEFAAVYFSVFRLVPLADDLKRKLFDFEDHLQVLAMEQGRKPARRIEDHILVLSRHSVTELEIERDGNEYLKSCAFLLHEVIDFCDGLLASRNSDWEEPLQFNRLYVEEDRKRGIVGVFSGSTGYGAIVMVRDRASEIIEDFRLTAFRARREDSPF